MGTTNADRRPIAARHWHLSRSLARLLADLRVSANAISIAGLAFGISAGVALAATRSFIILAPVLWLAAALFVLLRLAANMLDGMVAVMTNSASRVGELFNEVPDRLSDSAILIGLGFAAGQPSLGFCAAIAAIFTAYIRAVGKAAGTSQQFSGPMAKPQRMVLVIGVALFCAAIPNRWAPTNVLIVIAIGSAATAARRLMRISRQLRRGGP